MVLYSFSGPLVSDPEKWMDSSLPQLLIYTRIVKIYFLYFMQQHEEPSMVLATELILKNLAIRMVLIILVTLVDRQG